MKLDHCIQGSPEWFALKAAKVGGTRLGQATSSRKNRLIYELLAEKIDGYSIQSDYESEEMLFGKEQEPIAREAIIEATGIDFVEVGCIVSDTLPNVSLASPDGLNEQMGIVLEIKTTISKPIQLQRYFEGPESDKFSQIINYFVVSDDVKAVWWYSWNPYMDLHKLVKWVYTLDTLIKDGKKQTSIRELVKEAREELAKLEQELQEKYNQYLF